MERGSFAFHVLECIVKTPRIEEKFYASALDWDQSGFGQWLVREAESNLPATDNFFKSQAVDIGIFQYLSRHWKSKLSPKHPRFENRVRLLDSAKELFNTREQLVDLRKKTHRTLVENLKLKFDPGERDTILANIPDIEVHKLKKPIAEKGVWICDSRPIYNLWADHCANGPQADTRRKRPVPRVLYKNAYQHIVQPGQSARFVDSATGELVMLVKRNFCANGDILDWVNEIALHQTEQRRNIRMEDSGQMAQIGWSAGARSSPQFNWVRNLLKKLSEEETGSLNAKGSYAFAFFWNLVQNRLPQEVRDSFLEWLGCDIFSMNPANPDQKQGFYSILNGDKKVVIHNVEMAPPSGVFARNYSRPIHSEKQPHEWAASWTTYRSGGQAAGAHFVLAKYGIKVEGAADTLVVWRPQDEHGTTLPKIHPDDDEITLQLGLAIVTSSRLMGVWKKYQEQTWSEEVEQAAFEEYASAVLDGDDEDGDYEGDSDYMEDGDDEGDEDIEEDEENC